MSISCVCPTVSPHPVLPDLLVVEGSGPHQFDPVQKEIYVDSSCGMAVLRGANIFAPGIVGSNCGKYNFST